MAGEDKVFDAIRDQMASKVMEVGYASGKFDRTSEQDRKILQALSEMAYATFIFIYSTAKNGGKIDANDVSAFLVKKFGSQAKMLDVKILDCLFALADFAVDSAALGPVIYAGWTAGGATTASGVGAPVGMSLMVAAAVASAYLLQQSLAANATCQVALVDINQKSAEKPAKGTQIKVNTPLLSQGAVFLFEELARRDRSRMLVCPMP